MYARLIRSSEFFVLKIWKNSRSALICQNHVPFTVIRVKKAPCSRLYTWNLLSKHSTSHWKQNTTLKRARSSSHRFRGQKPDFQSQLFLHISRDNVHISRSFSVALSQSKANTCPTGFLLENPQQTHSSHYSQFSMPISMVKNSKDGIKILHLLQISPLKANSSLHKSRSVIKTPARPQRCQKWDLNTAKEHTSQQQKGKN